MEAELVSESSLSIWGSAKAERILSCDLEFLKEKSGPGALECTSIWNFWGG